MKKKCLIFIVVFFLFSFLFSQIINIREQEPYGIKWRKIDTKHFEIIFPDNIVEKGQKVADTLEFLYKAISKTLPNKQKKFSILLSANGVISNGYVSLGPRMSEWYMKPSNSYTMGAYDWVKLLAIHEGRHMVQFDKLTNHGFTKFMGYLYGDIGKGLFSAFSAPNWFFEGDAVGLETSLSNSGRGRQPGFDIHLRSLILSGNTPTYYKSILGSYKNRIPNHYTLGYFITTFVRKKYGADIWSKVLNFSSKHSYNPFSFSAGLKKHIGKNIKNIYNDTINDLYTIWSERLKDLNLTEKKRLNIKKKNIWTSYFSPRYEGNNIIVQKYGIDNVEQIIRIKPNGKEEKIINFTPIGSVFNNLNLKTGKIIWSEYTPDIRWGKRGYSEINVFDLKRNQKKTITSKTRYFEPDLSPDSKLIATVEFTTNQKSSIIILDSLNGKILKKFINSENSFLISPIWSEDGKEIVYISQNKNGRAMNLLDIDTEIVINLIPYSFESIGYPKFYNNYILYTSPYSGIDNIYAIDINTKKMFQVTSVKYGAYSHDISKTSKKLIFSNYTKDGFDIEEIPLSRSLWTPISEIEKRPPDYYKELILQEQSGSKIKLNNIPGKKYPVKKYYPLKKLFNIHSWGLIPDGSDLYLGIFSDNILGTASFNCGMKYNINEKVPGFELSGTYSGFFPIISFNTSLNNRSLSFETSEHKTINYKWKEKDIGLGIYIPLNFSRGIYKTRLNLGAGISFKEISLNENWMELEHIEGKLYPISFSLIFSRYQNSSSRYLKPLWGQFFKFSYKRTMKFSTRKGSILSIKSNLYFPGLKKNNNLIFQFAYEKQNPNNYYFSNMFIFSRGYDYRYNDSLFKLSANYTFPLFYPDFPFGDVLYLKRMSINLFYDYCIGKTEGKKSQYNSIGLELLADISLLNIPLNFQIGPRISYRFLDKKVRIDFISLNFNI